MGRPTTIVHLVAFGKWTVARKAFRLARFVTIVIVLVSELSRRWCRSVASMREATLRSAYLRSELTTTSPENAAAALDRICARAEQADTAAHEVLVALVAVLADPTLVELVATLRAVAEQAALLALARLLRGGPSLAPADDPEADAHTITDRRTGRPLTLGERKALARRPSRVTIERLLRDPHPLVIRMLLQNPRLTEDDVVRLAARRPARPDIVAEIARNPEWSKRMRVRLAIVRNPGSPSAIAVPMVRLLLRPELVEVAGAPEVPAIVRAAATEVLARRPPVPSSREGGTTH